MKLYAKYLKNKVRVTFNVGPNAQAIELKEYEPGSQLGTVNVTANEGYEFKGWYTTQTFDEGTLVNETYQVDNDVTLYAKVELKQYTVTFDVTNGQPIEQKTYNHGTQLGEIIVTPNEGYKFSGWYTEAGFTNKVDKTYQVKSDVTLYARIVDKNLIIDPQECDYFFTSKQDFRNRIMYILQENLDDLSQKTLGFDDSVTELQKDLNGGLFNRSLTKAPKMIFARNVTDFSYCFNNCINLTEIPATLFEKCTKATNFSSCFSECSSLATIPAGLFDSCTQVTDFNNCFSSCESLATIPAGLFDNCTQVTNFNECFRNCRSLTTIPAGLFDNCTQVTDFSWCFYDCRLITTIPAGLFDNCTQVTDFNHCFSSCSQLTEIPAGLFDNCTQVTNFNNCFSACTSLATTPAGLFDSCTQVTNFQSCFESCSFIMSAIPDAWNKEKFPNVTVYSWYAQSCTLASNYADIPADWK